MNSNLQHTVFTVRDPPDRLGSITELRILGNRMDLE